MKPANVIIFALVTLNATCRRINFRFLHPCILGVQKNNRIYTNRLQKELLMFKRNPPPNCTLHSYGSNNDIWLVTWTGLPGTIYQGETFKLKIMFPKEYPLKPPIMYFLHPVPMHAHVYSNGDICMSSLGSDYSPTASITSFVLSIMSMLSSAKEKSLPPDNHIHADLPPGSADARYMYHDDKC